MFGVWNQWGVSEDRCFVVGIVGRGGVGFGGLGGGEGLSKSRKVGLKLEQKKNEAAFGEGCGLASERTKLGRTF